ncbi:MAG: DNA adenine methylase [Campylobacter sp.]
MNKFNRAPLPFQGQKRNFIRLFNELIADEFCAHRNGIFIDVFGGSGLLSHNIKQIYSNACVIYNDYDGYCERLEHIDETNEILRAINPHYEEYFKNEPISPKDKVAIIQILDDFKRKGYFIDWLTFSSVLFYGGKYAHNEAGFKKEKTFFAGANGETPTYNAKGYLKGVEIVRKDGMELIKEFKNDGAVLILDPPYLQTDKAGYKCFWGLRDFLKLIRLVKKPFIFFGSKKSNILDFIDDMVEYGDKVFKNYKTKTAKLSFSSKSDADYMIYKSGVKELFDE